ncbi:MAG: acyl-CoA synthetase FdrA [candidate division Zixibacteria bacterium]|nr:acyl-CoA synthetase FdrA [candidate division Zixibacteria bacterium]
MQKTKIECEIYPNEYRDSMVLMNVSRQLEETTGVKRTMAVMGTPGNKALLKQMGLFVPETEKGTPNDLIVVFEPDAGADLGQVRNRISEILTGPAEHGGGKACAHDGPAAPVYRTVTAAAEYEPDVNLAVVSVPGEFAAREADLALDAGMNVFMWSDGVPIEDEVRLKSKAVENGLLMMGPECGTSLVNGVCLGISSVVRRGPVGALGASGSGLQEIYTLLDRAGIGVTHAIGTGGRDLKEAVGGLTTLQSIDFFDGDEDTKVIVNVSKKPESAVAKKVLDRVSVCTKPVVVCFLGENNSTKFGDNVHIAATIEDAVDAVGEILGQKIITRDDDAALAKVGPVTLRPEQKYIRGLFTGGTFCQEATLIWKEALGEVWAVHSMDPEFELTDPEKSIGHTALDIGEEYFTVGRPHAAIDPVPRIERMEREIEEKEVAVIVLDIELGHGSHPDMAGALAPSVKKAREKGIYVITHVCGTELDPQNVVTQEKILAEAGSVVAETNAAAARIALKILGT